MSPGPQEGARGEYRDLVRQIKDLLSLDRVIGGKVKLQKKGREFVGLCPFHIERTPSFTVVPAKGFYFCFGCGAHGDAIKFYMDLHRVAFLDAISDLAAEAGLEGAPHQGKPRHPLAAPPTPNAGAAKKRRESEAEREARMVEHARELWREARPGADTIVETYLADARRIDLDAIGGVPPTLRFHAGLKTGRDNGDVIYPGMVAPIQDVTGRLIGIHRTFLKADGSGKAEVPMPAPHRFDAKRTLGGVWGGAIRLCPLPSVDKGGDTLAIGEGIETSLTVLCDLARQCLKTGGSPMPVWCAINLGNIAGAGDADAQRRARFHPTKERIDPETGEVLGRMRLPTEMPDMARPGLILPGQVRRLYHLADADSDPWITRALIERATRRRQAEGVEVRNVWPPRGFDFSDLKMRERANERVHA